MIIKNASSVPLSANTGTLPDVSGALNNWLQPMTFFLLIKEIIGLQVVETPTDINFSGVWQPYTFEQLKLLPEGERHWKWFKLHTLTGLSLKTDDVVSYLGENYRVMNKGAYPEYGFWEYDLIKDYVGSGP